MPIFRIMMIGPEAVGKTTLLATMYKELIKMEGYNKFTFSAENDTGINLENAYQKISRIIEQPTFTSIIPLLEGTRGVIEHKFGIAFKNKEELELVFYDIAGGLVTVRASDEEFKRFKNNLNEASVIINVIDGAALVEGSELFSDRINRPTRIRDLLLTPLNDKQNHLILFVVTKCEAWLKTGEGRFKLERLFRERYKEVINLIEQRQNAVGVLIPVKTLGCVEFSLMEGKDTENEKAVFVRRVRLPFKPEVTDQPLRYALAFVLSERDSNRNWWERFSRWWGNTDSAFKESLIQFIKDRDSSFKMYGNISLIKVIR